MEKVKLTKEQAKVIEFAKKNHPKIDIVKAYVNYRGWRLCGELDSLKLLEFDDLIKALYIGYEIAPEFKVGDWVILQNGKIGKIEWINYSKNLVSIHAYEVGVVCIDDIERHATPDECYKQRVEELELEVNDWQAEVQKWQKFYKESEESHSETKELLKSTVNQNKRYREALKNIHELAEYDEYNNTLEQIVSEIEKALEGKG